jgi:hypothetical protein
MPVLGMFRKDIDTLADDLSGFIHRVFCGNGFPVAGDKILKGDGGGLGDAALLCFSPAEDKGDRLRSSQVCQWLAQLQSSGRPKVAA